MEKYYYHITEFKNLTDILKTGLKANKQGEIFIFKNTSFKIPALSDIENTVAESIAVNQLNIKEYVLFRVSNKGIKTELIPDNVGEITSIFQWIIKQPLIEPKYLKFIGVYTANYTLII